MDLSLRSSTKYFLSLKVSLNECLSIIVLNNVFGADACSTLLLFKLETSLWKYVKPFMELLNILPDGELKDIKNDEKVESILRDI